MGFSGTDRAPTHTNLPGRCSFSFLGEKNMIVDSNTMHFYTIGHDHVDIFSEGVSGVSAPEKGPPCGGYITRVHAHRVAFTLAELDEEQVRTAHDLWPKGGGGNRQAVLRWQRQR
nr:hypothetical protein [Pandoravirus massiliensis]